VWRVLTPLVFIAAGVLFVTSAVSSGGTDLRAGRYQDLAGLVEAQSRQVERARVHAADLTAQVNGLSAGTGSGLVKRAQGKVTELRGLAGLEPARGSGLTVTLDDAPPEIQATAANVSDAIVHQQDIQAVANALWAGGATAMTIQGQRVVSTTGIKCVGNTVVLHDVPYAPPYVISAIGPVSEMAKSISDSTYIGFYLQAVDRYSLGWKISASNNLHLPGFTGPTELSYARAVPRRVAAPAGHAAPTGRD
jgi:uncharacterized protein YlxW (UPF0749 family)